MATRVFRFALGSTESPASGLWRVWTVDDEIHAAVRTTSATVALTAYPTGRWRIAVGTSVSRWTRPREFRPGWTRGPDVIIPHAAAPVQSPDDPFAKEPLTWLRPPAPGHLVRIALLFAGRRAEESRWRPPDAPGTESVMVLPLRTSGTLHICRTDEPIAAEDLSDAGKLSPNAGSDLSHPPSTGSIGFTVIISADPTGRPSLRESHEV